MAFNKFEITIIKKLCLIIFLMILSTYSFFILKKEYAIYITVFSIIAITISIRNLFIYVTKTNKKLTSFLESIKHSDFSVKFKSDPGLGKSFNDLNKVFNTVLEAFQKERSEKLEHLQYLNTIVKHVNVGLIAFDPKKGEIELINKQAKILLDVFFLKNIGELEVNNKNLFDIITDLTPGESKTMVINANTHLAIFATLLRFSNRSVKIIAIQNIHKELLSKEVESWQKLASVLRHEIMNSITPITSINSTLLNIVNEDFQNKSDSSYNVNNDSFEDLKEGLIIIDDRTKALIKFINAYREYTSIPQTQFYEISIKNLLHKATSLMKVQLKEKNIALTTHFLPDDIINITGDSELLEMVIINLIKNAMDAVKDVQNPEIIISYGVDSNHNPFISINDNGTGITQEAIEKIFIPFFTTKSEGSGIGLSLSRQIMQMHNGSLSLDPENNTGTTFNMKFYRN